MNVFAWSLIALGVIYFVTESVLFAPGRWLLAKVFGPAVYCKSCVGFWVGMLLAIVGAPLTVVGLTPGPHATFVGLASAFAASALGTAWSKLFPFNPAYSTEWASKHSEVSDDSDSE